MSNVGDFPDWQGSANVRAQPLFSGTVSAIPTTGKAIFANTLTRNFQYINLAGSVTTHRCTLGLSFSDVGAVLSVGVDIDCDIGPFNYCLPLILDQVACTGFAQANTAAVTMVAVASNVPYVAQVPLRSDLIATTTGAVAPSGVVAIDVANYWGRASLAVIASQTLFNVDVVGLSNIGSATAIVYATHHEDTLVRYMTDVFIGPRATQVQITNLAASNSTYTVGLVAHHFAGSGF